MIFQSDLAAKDISIQSLGVKISKKSEELSELSEELDLYKAKDSENTDIIAELRRAKSPDNTGSDADSIGMCILASSNYLSPSATEFGVFQHSIRRLLGGRGGREATGVA